MGLCLIRCPQLKDHEGHLPHLLMIPSHLSRGLLSQTAKNNNRPLLKVSQASPHLSLASRPVTDWPLQRLRFARILHHLVLISVLPSFPSLLS